MVPFWETLEGVLKINCFWNKNFEIPQVNEDNLTFKQQAVVDFILTNFGEEHLNLKCIVGIDTKAVRRHLGYHLYIGYSFAPYFVCMTNFHFLFAEKIAPKNAMAEFRCHLLKRPHEGGDGFGLVSSGEPKISPIPGSPAPKAPLLKK